MISRDHEESLDNRHNDSGSVSNKIKYACAIGIPVIGLMGVVGYETGKIKRSNKVSGLDRSVIDDISYSTLSTVVNIDTDIVNKMDRIEISIRKKLNSMYQDPSSVINRYTVCLHDHNGHHSDKIIHGYIDNRAHQIDDKINSIVHRKNLTLQEEKAFLGSTFVSDNDVKLNIVIDDVSNKIYIQSNRAYFDDQTFNGITRDLLTDSSHEYLDQIPTFKYVPFVSEYNLVRTAVDKFKMKHPQITHNPDLSVDKGYYHMDTILHFNIDESRIIGQSKNPLFIAQYVHMMMSLFFDAYLSRDYYNVTILCALENIRKINNIASISFTIKRKHTVEDVKRKINKRKHMIWGSYFYSNSFLNSNRSTSNNQNIDVCISSIPFLKDGGIFSSIESIIRYGSAPVHIINRNIGITSSSSIHFGTDELDTKTFEDVLNKNNIKIHEKTVFEKETRLMDNAVSKGKFHSNHNKPSTYTNHLTHTSHTDNSNHVPYSSVTGNQYNYGRYGRNNVSYSPSLATIHEAWYDSDSKNSNPSQGSSHVTTDYISNHGSESNQDMMNYAISAYTIEQCVAEMSHCGGYGYDGGHGGGHGGHGGGHGGDGGDCGGM